MGFDLFSFFQEVFGRSPSCVRTQCNCAAISHRTEVLSGEWRAKGEQWGRRGRQKGRMEGRRVGEVQEVDEEVVVKSDKDMTGEVEEGLSLSPVSGLESEGPLYDP